MKKKIILTLGSIFFVALLVSGTIISYLINSLPFTDSKGNIIGVIMADICIEN